jgi:hypothetical protein
MAERLLAMLIVGIGFYFLISLTMHIRTHIRDVSELVDGKPSTAYTTPAMSNRPQRKVRQKLIQQHFDTIPSRGLTDRLKRVPVRPRIAGVARLYNLLDRS